MLFNCNDGIAGKMKTTEETNLQENVYNKRKAENIYQYRVIVIIK